MTATAPLWMAERLRRCGLRFVQSASSTSRNYVMLETRPPLHASTRTRCDGPIGVRPRAAGETLKLLDEREIALRCGFPSDHRWPMRRSRSVA
jgi:phenylalanyl-tRNA synthetase beta chain